MKLRITNARRIHLQNMLKILQLLNGFMMMTLFKLDHVILGTQRSLQINKYANLL